MMSTDSPGWNRDRELGDEVIIAVEILPDGPAAPTLWSGRAKLKDVLWLEIPVADASLQVRQSVRDVNQNRD